MTTLALLLIFPVLWPFVAKALWGRNVTLLQMALSLTVTVLVVCAGWAIGRYAQALDTEIINGQVVSKSSDRVSCEHSYSCNCTETCSGSGNSRSCSTTCQTCFEHSYDVDWNLHTTVGDIKINRINAQGTREPPRYSRAAVGDPVAREHSFQNYVKAAPDSLFNVLSEKKAYSKYQSLLPKYPSTVYDYHYIDRVLTVGVAVPDVAQWNQDLAMRLRRLGPSKQANLVLVFTKEADPDYADALRSAWLGGKKNDVIVVFGTPAYPAVEWARVISWTDQELFKVQLRDELQELKTLDRQTVLDIIDKHVTNEFSRKHMADFAYLKNQIEPPTWAIALLFMLSILSSVGLTSAYAHEVLSRYRFR